MKRYYYFLFLFITLFGCTKQSSKENTDVFGEGSLYRAVIGLPEGELPFWLELSVHHGDTTASFINSSETLKVRNVTMSGDSVFIPGHIFESEIRVKIEGDSLVGNYIRKNSEKPYSIPFYAVKNRDRRFWENPDSNVADFSGDWEVDFLGDSSKAIGRFEQTGTLIVGTFLTPTGDYRFLEGQVSGNEMRLSTFDGAHAFLFVAQMNGETIEGTFFSGKHWKENWRGVRNADFRLPSADSLTFLVDPSDKIEYTYIDDQGDTVAVKNSSLIGKVTVIQILGTWCPNCMDETMFLVPLKNKFPELNVVGLSFERPMDYERAYVRINKLKQLLNVNYPMYYAGKADKGIASEAFPMLNRIMSFPTTIVVDKQGVVRKIHTGFNGPGTGVLYDRFSDDFYKLMVTLGNEEISG